GELIFTLRREVKRTGREWGRRPLAIGRGIHTGWILLAVTPDYTKLRQRMTATRTLRDFRGTRLLRRRWLILFLVFTSQRHRHPLGFHGARDQFARAVQARLDQRRRQAQRVGDFLIREVVPVAQDEHSAILRGKGVEHLLHLVGDLALDGGLLWTRADIGDPF